jgi:hypothetical protein
MFKPNKHQIKNLRKLADYLLALPEGYQHFDMTSFFANSLLDEDEWWDFEDNPCNLTKKHYNVCGTVACAIGHAPAAGINCKGLNSFWEVAELKMGLPRILYEPINEWRWLFASNWADVDNTPQGAGKRIHWLLDKGLPSDWNEQLCGDTRLCYLEE